MSRGSPLSGHVSEGGCLELPRTGSCVFEKVREREELLSVHDVTQGTVLRNRVSMSL